jgi:lipoprotein-anchoring transpeptidase ErfK/SrfK
MNKQLRFFLGFLVAASLAVVTIGVPAAEADKAKDAKAVKAEKGQAAQKVLFENDKVRVFEVTFKPGDVAANVERPLRIIRPLKGGTLTLIYADGKKDKRTFKTGVVQVVEPSPAYTPKNEGKSDIVLYVVYVKDAKK